MADFDFKTTSFEFKGFKELYRAIDHLPEVVKKQELEPLLVEAMEPMRDKARSLAPNDPLTGPPWDLPTSIEVSNRQRSGKAERGLGRFDARAYMGPTKFGYPQAIFQEFGTVRHPARAYMRPAWDSEKKPTLDRITAKLGDRLMMIARKYGPKG